MPLVSKSRLNRTSYVAHKSLDEVRRELQGFRSKGLKSLEEFDVFLSHRYLDAREVLALKIIIESYGLSVYVDWIDSPEAERANVTKETAALLRNVMKRSSSLVYAFSGNSSGSKWMPWELGFSDGLHGRVAVVPVTDQQGTSESFQGQEYLGIYPYLTLGNNRMGEEKLWVRESASNYASLPDWIKGAALRSVT
jgi:hypothetical protein